MRCVVRKVGNSLGILIPIEIARSWGVAHGDFLEIDENGIRPFRMTENAQTRLDKLKREISIRVLGSYDLPEIRAKALSNIARWKANGVNGAAYAEWSKILRSKNDQALIQAMVGKSEESNRLRQSMPYTGMLPQDEVRRMREKATS
jgi:antitoxin component of MazEF toxin-antitoxin module